MTEVFRRGASFCALQYEHYSLALERVHAGNPLDERSYPADMVVKADVVCCDESLGPIDPSVESIGENRRMHFVGRFGSCAPGAT